MSSYYESTVDLYFFLNVLSNNRLFNSIRCAAHVRIHKCPYIAVSSKCSMKPLSKLVTSVLSPIKNGLQSYCETAYSRGGVNQMWILKNSKDISEYIQSNPLSSCNSIKTFDFSTLYTSSPHPKLKDKLK